jgi:hypothetical protein
MVADIPGVLIFHKKGLLFPTTDVNFKVVEILSYCVMGLNMIEWGVDESHPFHFEVFGGSNGE